MQARSEVRVLEGSKARVSEDFVPYNEGDGPGQFVVKPLKPSLGGIPYTLFPSGLAPSLLSTDAIITHNDPFLSTSPNLEAQLNQGLLCELHLLDA